MIDEKEDGDRVLVKFLQDYAPHAAKASSRLEDDIFQAIAQESHPAPAGDQSLADRRWPVWALMAAVAALLLALFWYRSHPQDNYGPIAKDLEKSWDGVLANNQDIGLQSLFSDLD